MEDLKVIKFREDIERLIYEYIDNVESEFKYLWNNWDIKIAEKEMYEVIGGIIARQITIASQFIISMNNWTNDLAPIILRCMADNYINFAWILKDPLERSRKFIYFGIGNEKLVTEHRKNQMIENGSSTEEDLVIEYSKKWVNFQQYDFLTTVDLGNWSQKSVYQMAEEAECKDFYNYAYQPFSVATHNMWNHIGKHNMKISDNPLHNFLLIPQINKPKPGFNYIRTACKYVEKMFIAYYKKFDLERYSINSYDVVYERFDELLNDLTEEE